MIKKYYILFLIALVTQSVFGQFVGKDNLSKSLFYMQKSNLDSAKKYIDLASKNENENKTSKTWYYKGFIYKELYKAKEKSNKTSPYRIESINSFEKLLNLDTSHEFFESTTKILSYLASTLYNDAARSLNMQSYQTAQSNYALFRKTMLMTNPNIDLKPQDIKFNLALASMFNQPTESGQKIDSNQIEKIKQIYNAVLDLDPENGPANYNLGIIYYNNAADIVNKMDYDMDLESLNKQQDHFIELLLKALPYMKKSYELKWNPKETTLALSNIYYGLNDMEKSEIYKKELENLDKGH